MRFAHLAVKGIGVLSLIAGCGVIVAVVLDEQKHEPELIVQIIGTSIGLLFLGLLFLNISRVTVFIGTLGRDTQQLLLKAALYTLVGAFLIWFWWYLIEVPKIEHTDIRKVCEWVHRNKSEWARSEKIEECYSNGIYKHR